MMPVVVLAGGLATRLRPITEAVPKSMVEIRERPFIYHQLRLLREKRVSEVVLCVGHLGWMIEDYVGCGNAFGLSVSYSRDGDKLLGTGGAALKASTSLNKPFFLLYGDSYLDIDYAAVEAAWSRGKTDALMTVYKNNGRWDTSNAVFENGMVIRYDKKHSIQGMRYIDYGLSVLSAGAFDSVESGSVFDLSEVYGRLAEEGRLSGHEVFTRFYEIGSQEGIKDFNDFVAGKDDDIFVG